MSVLPAPCISLNTAAVLPGRSVRTWQRRIEEGLVPRLVDERGRALVAWDAVRPALALRLDEAEVELLVRADHGDGDDIALLDIGRPRLYRDAFRLSHVHLADEKVVGVRVGR